MRQYADIDRKKEFDKWKKRISYMESYFKDAETRHKWKQYAQFLWGDVASAMSLNFPIVVVNEIFAYLKTAIAGLYAKNPFIAINPTKQSEIVGAIIKEQMINYRWRELNLKKEVKRCIAEAKLIGHVWIKVGYTAETEKDFTSPSADELNEYIVGEKIWAVRVPYNEIYFDPDAKDVPYDCRWIIHHYLKPIDVLEAKYGLPAGSIKPTGKYTREFKDATGNRSIAMPESDNKTMVYEIYDKDSGYKFVMCDGWEPQEQDGDGFLEAVAPASEGCIGSYEMEGLPFIFLKFNDFPSPDGRDNFPMSDVAAWVDQFLEKVKFRSHMVNHVKRWVRQLLAKTGVLSNTEKEKFTQAQDGAIIEMNGNPTADVAAVPYAPIPNDVYAIEAKLDIDRDRVSGQAQFEQGGPANSKTRTLGEIEQIQAGTGARRLEQVDIIQDFCAEVARKLIQLEKQFSDVEKIVRVTSEIPVEYLKQLHDEGKFDGRSIHYTKEDIQGDEDIDIEAGSTLPLNKENRINTCIQVGRFGPAFGLTPNSLASMALGKVIMHDMGIKAVEIAYEKDMERLLQPKEPTPEEKLKLISQKQAVDKAAVDTELKKRRTDSVNLANVNKALENARKLRGEDQMPAQPPAGAPNEMQ